MNVVLTLGRSAPAGSDAVYLDFKRHEVSRRGVCVRVWPRCMTLVAAVLCSPQQLTTDDLIDHIYGEHADGGPATANKAVHTFLYLARRRLAPIGISFRSRYARGHEAIDLWSGARTA